MAAAAGSGLAGDEAEGVRGVGAAAEGEVSVVGRIPMAVHAAGAGADLVDAALFQLVQVVVVHGKRAVHEDEVQIAARDEPLEILRIASRVHVGDRAHGNAHGFLDLGGHGHHDAEARLIGLQHALPVASKVELGAVACGALDAGAAEVQVAGKLGDVLAAGPDADMQRVGASGLDELAHLLVLLHGGEEGGVADGLVVLLNAVDEHLDREVGTAFGLDAAHALLFALGLLRADPAADRGQRAVAGYDGRRPGHIALPQGVDEFGNPHPHGAGRHTAGVLAVQAARRFEGRFFRIVAVADLLEVGRTACRVLFAHSYARYLR